METVSAMAETKLGVVVVRTSSGRWNWTDRAHLVVGESTLCGRDAEGFDTILSATPPDTETVLAGGTLTVAACKACCRAAKKSKA